MTKRKVGLYIVLLAIIIGAAPYFTGYLVETKFQDVVKVTSEFEPLKVEVTEYQRGWRKSYAKTRVTLQGQYLEKLMLAIEKNNPSKSSELKNQEMSIILEHEIRHGPFVQLQDNNYRDWRFALATIQSKLFLTEKAKEVLTSEFGSSELLNIDTQMSIEGDVQIKMQGKALKLKEPDGKEHVIWKGIQANWVLSRDMKRFQGDTFLPGFDFDWEGKHYFGENIIFKTERVKSPEGLWLGKGTMTMQKMEVNQTPEQSLSIEGLSMGGVVGAENSMIDSSGSVNIEQIKYANRLWGPINLAFSTKNIDVHVAKSFGELSHQMQMATSAEEITYIQKMAALLPDLLKTRPEFNIENMTVHTDQGDIKGLLNLAIGGAAAYDLNNPQQIFQSIALKANVLFPKTLLREILISQYSKKAEAINEAAKSSNLKTSSNEEITATVGKSADEAISKQIQQGTLVEKDRNYLIEVELFQGHLKVNGKSMDLPQAGLSQSGPPQSGTPQSGNPNLPAEQPSSTPK
ncbi:MAG: YdgA family protein [Candidatus Berkiellales bacterium]